MIPHWVSPNLISVVGGVNCVAASICSVIAARVAIRWFYFVGPTLMFIYVTADAVDGKHARRTEQSTPLGAVVDHGIDAFCAFTTGLAVTSTVDWKLSTARMMLAFCMFHLSWFSAQWGELELGSLDQRGITEGEFATMFVWALPGLVGEDPFRWLLPLPHGSLEFSLLMECGVIVGCGLVALSFLVKVLLASKGRRLQACTPFLHFCLHSLAGVCLARTVFGQAYPLFNFVVVGMDAAMLMTKVRLAATLHCPWPKVHFETLPFLAVAALHIAFGGELVGLLAFSAVLAWQAFALVMLWTNTINRICAVLDIPFLAPVPQKKQ